MRTTPGLDDAFDRAAGRYDLLTRLNPGYHRHLRAAAQALVERIGAGPAPLVLDLGCGSGASTAALVAARDDLRVVAVDASSGMLARARAKPWPAGVEFVHATAEALPGLGLPSAAGALAAYLVRNIPEDGRDEVLRIIRDRLAPGGWLVVQEYSVAGRRSAVLAWTLVCRLVVVPLARLVHGSPRLYGYLWRSVLDFDSTAELADRLVGAGFTEVAHRDATGWQRGILHTWVARRPAG
ncbi:class I SAM-dependent methyltransferase [Propionicimonas sp.]|uniref:class I SAM-dependent methyltransferase n=1 Tax=Propionicimonas sp. TaxID=1955623 RepID=UPI0039E295B6